LSKSAALLNGYSSVVIGALVTASVNGYSYLINVNWKPAKKAKFFSPAAKIAFFDHAGFLDKKNEKKHSCSFVFILIGAPDLHEATPSYYWQVYRPDPACPGWHVYPGFYFGPGHSRR
jgi:hypothetical protein